MAIVRLLQCQLNNPERINISHKSIETDEKREVRRVHISVCASHPEALASFVDHYYHAISSFLRSASWHIYVQLDSIAISLHIHVHVSIRTVQGQAFERQIRSAISLLMHWFLASPAHQQSFSWRCELRLCQGHCIGTRCRKGIMVITF